MMRALMGSERDLLNRFLQSAEEAREFFGNPGLEFRERTIVHGLLNVLDIDHADDEIVKAGPEPIDVRFRDACFQIVAIMDAGRRIGDELRKREARTRSATSIDDLLEPVSFDRRPFAQDELIALVVDSARKKAARYGEECINLDLLAAVVLQYRYAVDVTAFPRVPELEGWRSVSVVLEGFGVVLWAGHGAPHFLRDRMSQPFTKFEGGTIFDLKPQ